MSIATGRERELHSREGESHTTTALSSNVSPSNGDKEPAFTQASKFDGGSTWITLPDERTFLPNSNIVTIIFLVDIGKLGGGEPSYTVLHTSENKIAAGKHPFLGTATGLLSGAITDDTEEKCEVGFPSMIVAGLGRYL